MPRILTLLRTGAITAGAAAALLLALLQVAAPVVLGLIALTTAVLCWALMPQLVPRSTPAVLGAFIAQRVALAAAASAVAIAHGTHTAWVIAASALLVLLITSEPRLRAVYRPTVRHVHNLPGAGTGRHALVRPGLLPVTTLAATVALSAAPVLPEVLGPAMAPVTTAALVAALITTAISVPVARRLPQRQAADVRRAMEDYAPRFAVYLTGPGGTAYQLQGWASYLDRIGLPWVVILREGRHLQAISTMTSAPIVTGPSLSALEQLLVPSLSTVFYVNNGFKNSHCVRYREITHVQLLHGDSDKASSFNPVTAMFDKIFVAGQAGIDRYHNHGIDIPLDRFEIVGRPQVAQIDVVPEPRDPDRRPVVLYAPTWEGFHSDASYSSLPIGEEIVSVLLELGATVVFRPHPYSARNARSRETIARIDALLAGDPTGGHLFGDAATTEIDLIDCFNRSDALVSDVSAVPADYLFSGKPFAVTRMSRDSITSFLAEFPLARAAYLLSASPGSEDGTDVRSGLRAKLTAMLGDDTMRADRLQMREYYLGPFPAEGYDEVFVRAARRVVMDSAEQARQEADHRLDAEARGADDTATDDTGVELEVASTPD